MVRIPSYRKHKASGQAVVTIMGKSYYLGPHVDSEKQPASASYREYLRLVEEWQETHKLPEAGVRDLRQPAYRHHKASRQAVVRLGGKDLYLGRHGSAESKRRYRKLMAEWQASGGSVAVTSKQTDITIVEVLAAYLKHAKAYYGTKPDSEYFHYKRAVRRIKSLYSTELAESFGPLQFKALRDSIGTHTRTLHARPNRNRPRTPYQVIDKACLSSTNVRNVLIRRTATVLNCFLKMAFIGVS